MVELGIDVWRFGGGVESVAGVLVVGLVYGSVSAGVGHGRGFQIGFQVVGFRWVWAVGLIVVIFGLRFEKWV